MSLDAIAAASSDGARSADLTPLARTAEEHFYLAMLLTRDGDVTGAATLAEQASRLDRDRAVYAETARYLARLETGEPTDVYATPEAFTAFASGGGNVGLYQATHRALRDLYAAQRPHRLLDIGTGEGHGLLPALTPDVSHVDFVEPSVPRGELVATKLASRNVSHRGYPMTAQQFTELADVGPWDLVQETFALLALDRRDRLRLFGWLRARTKRLTLVEFDTPDAGLGLTPSWFRYVIERYERGVREYDQDRDLVAQGFLIPVLLGVLGDGSHQRHHEQPIARWIKDLAVTGFQPEPPRHLYDYWWGPAYLVSAV
ncbi:MAG TPA: class I SAM-dependent methyltransferase [Micromonosporaceae bacterium]